MYQSPCRHEAGGLVEAHHAACGLHQKLYLEVLHVSDEQPAKTETASSLHWGG